MELQEATPYRERMTYVLSQLHPPPTEGWVEETPDQLTAPFESRGSDGTAGMATVTDPSA